MSEIFEVVGLVIEKMFLFLVMGVSGFFLWPFMWADAISVEKKNRNRVRGDSGRTDETQRIEAGGCLFQFLWIGILVWLFMQW